MAQVQLRTYKDAVVIITGGASGIGRALGEELARRGAEVVLADLQAELAEEVAAGIRAKGGKARALGLDVTDFNAVNRLVLDTMTTSGRLDYLFNNAGIVAGGTPEKAVESGKADLRGLVRPSSVGCGRKKHGRDRDTLALAGLVVALPPLPWPDRRTDPARISGEQEGAGRAHARAMNKGRDPTSGGSEMMSIGFEGELVQNGQRFRVPARFEHATATHLYSLLDLAAACRLCDGENYEPLPIVLRDGAIRAAGFTAAVDYHRTDAGPYREWILGIWVGLRGEKAPPLAHVNAASLAFGSMLAGDQGFTIYSPKMLLTESLPTELGLVHYGIPKERGDVLYQRSERETHFAATDAAGRLLMRASVPTRRGFMTRLGMGFSFLRAFGIRSLLRAAWRNEIPTILAGSAKLLPRNARVVAKVDSHSQIFAWDPRDCRLEFGSESEWGKVLHELRFAPSLVCHIPNLSFSFSGPIEQVNTRGAFQGAQ